MTRAVWPTHGQVFEPVRACGFRSVGHLRPQPRRRRKVAGGQAELTLEEGRS